MAIPRLGLVGVGTFGINHLRCFRQMGYSGEVELVAACDVNEDLLRQRDRGTMTCCTGDRPPLQTHNQSFLRRRQDRGAIASQPGCG